MDSVTVICCKNPFDPYYTRVVQAFPPGLTVNDYLMQLYPDYKEKDYEIAVAIDGKVRQEDGIMSVVLAERQSLALVAVPGRGGGGKSVVALVAMLAIMVLAPYAGGLLAAEFGAAFSMELTAGSMMLFDVGMAASYAVGFGAVMVAGGILLNSLAPKPSSDTVANNGMTYSWGPKINAVQQGSILPVLYGTHRVTPPLVSRYIKTDGDKQYFNGLYAVAEGPIDSVSETNIRLNNKAVTQYTGVKVYTKNVGTATQNPVANFEATLSDMFIGLTLKSRGTLSNGTGHTALLDGAITADPSHVTMNIDSPTLTGTIVVGEEFTVAGDSTTYTVTYGGTASGNRIDGIEFTPSVQTSWANNAVVTFDNELWSTSAPTSETDADELEIAINFPNGLYNMSSGKMAEQSVKVEIQYHDGTWKPLLSKEVTPVTTSVTQWEAGVWYSDYLSGDPGEASKMYWLRLDIGSTTYTDHIENDSYIPSGWTVPPGVYLYDTPHWEWRTSSSSGYGFTGASTSYAVITADQTNAVWRTFKTGKLVTLDTTHAVRARFYEAPPKNAFGVDTPGIMTTCRLESVQSSIPVVFRYPYTALISINALATSQLSGTPTLDCVATRSMVPVWTGASYENKPCINPAWACYDILHNSRYGAGIPYSKLDYDSFLSWASFCQTNGYYVNIYFDTSFSVKKALDTVSLLGRGRVIQIGNKFTVLVDKVDTATQRFLFTPGNIITDSFSVDFLPMTDRANAVEVTYYDSEYDYTPQIVELFADGYDTATTEIRKASISLPGCVYQGMASRYGKFLLNSNRYLTQTASWDADVDAIACIPGDVVDVTHDMPAWGEGGRIVSATATTVVLDRPVNLAGGKTYYIMVKHQDDDTVEGDDPAIAITTAAGGPYTTLDVAGWTHKTPVAFSAYALGPTNQVTKKFRVMTISRTQDLRAKITGLEYIPEVYVDDATIPPPQFGVDPTGVSRLQAREVYRGGESAISTSTVTLTWQGFAGVWYVYIQRGKEKWEYAGKTSTRRYEILNLNIGTTYGFYVSTTDVMSGGQTTSITITGSNSAPAPAVSEGSFYGTQTPYGWKLYWDGVFTDPGAVVTYEIKVVTEQTQATYDGFGYTLDYIWGNAICSGWTPIAVTTGTQYNWVAGDSKWNSGYYQIWFIIRAKHNGVYSEIVRSPQYYMYGPSGVTGISWEPYDYSWTAGVWDGVVISCDYPSEATFAGCQLFYKDMPSGEEKPHSLMNANDGRTRLVSYFNGTWTGTRRFTFVTYDYNGKTGGGQTLDIAFAVSPPSGLSSTVIDNNVLLKWTAPSTVNGLPLDRYELRKGTTWAAGEVIGSTKATFSVYYETVAQTATYWVAAIDQFGTYSTPISTTCTVNQPPDYVLLTSFASTFPQTYVGSCYDNVVKDGSTLLAPVPTWTMSYMYSASSWTTPEIAVNSGAKMWLHPATITNSARYTEFFDYGASVDASLVTLDYQGEQLWGTPTIAPEISFSSTSNTNPFSCTWGTPIAANQAFGSAFRWVRANFTFAATSLNHTYRMNNLTAKLDVKMKTLSGVTAVWTGDAGGTSIDITSKFLDVQGITLTPLSAGTAQIPVYDFVDIPNPTHFHIYLFNTAGARLGNGTDQKVSWVVRGV